jgi:phospholipase/carboxylesterase
MDFQPMKYIFQPTTNPSAATLLLLHGTGGNEHDLLLLAKEFGDSFNILSLRGNVTENGMPRFFRRLGMGIFDEADLAFRTDEMVSFIKELSVIEGFDSTKIIALGYSNGANIAGATLVQYPDFLAGAILYRPMQPFKQLPDFRNTEKTPVFISTGKYDPTIRVADTTEYVQALEKAGFAISSYLLSTSHNLTQEDITLTSQWLANTQVLSKTA